MMTRFMAEQPELYRGTSVGDGNCIAFVRRVARMPDPQRWRRGPRVRGGDLSPGTVIATFTSNGTYGNQLDGRSHAAILIAENSDGLLVWDQWFGQTVHQRVIRFRGGQGEAINDGDQFFAIQAVADA
jgi:hypothetical protein